LVEGLGTAASIDQGTGGLFAQLSQQQVGPFILGEVSRGRTVSDVANHGRIERLRDGDCPRQSTCDIGGQA
jgi:hypothetical protein